MEAMRNARVLTEAFEGMKPIDAIKAVINHFDLEIRRVDEIVFCGRKRQSIIV
jgi:hypothetical protein